MHVYIYIYISSLFIYQFLDTDCFCNSAIVNNAAMNIGVHVSFCISVLVLDRSEIAGSCDHSGFSFLGKLHCFPQWLH